MGLIERTDYNANDIIIIIIIIIINNNNNKYMAATASKNHGRLERFPPDGIAGSLVVSKALYLYPIFSFLDRISLLVTSSRYPVVPREGGGPLSRSYNP